MSKRVASFGVLILVAALSGCSSLPQACVAPARMMASAEMLFGRNIGDRLAVSEAAFAKFLADDVTPHFPDGLTVIDAKGQWRDDKGMLLREPGKLLLIVFADDDVRKRAALVAVADSYKRKFRQQVLTSVRAACVSF